MVTDVALAMAGHHINQHINQLQIQFRAPDDERCAAGNMLRLQKTLE
jgi:hypothetical protein